MRRLSVVSRSPSAPQISTLGNPAWPSHSRNSLAAGIRTVKVARRTRPPRTITRSVAGGEPEEAGDEAGLFLVELRGQGRL
jgi:hypothetical protein